MALLPSKSVRPKFQDFPTAFICTFAALASKIIPITGKASVPAKPAIGGKPPVEAVPAVIAVKGIPALVPFFSYSEDAANTTITFRLPLSAGAGVGSALQAARLLAEVDAVVSEAISFPDWFLGETYALEDEPSWCKTFEQFVAWLAKRCGATISSTANMQALDFKVVLNNDDLGNINLLVGSVAAPIVKTLKVMLYSGTGIEQAIPLGFKPELLFLKSRNTYEQFQIYDSVRSAGKVWRPAAQDNQVITEAEGVKALTPAGVTIGTADSVNKVGTNFIAYAFPKSADVADRFLDVVAYTGDGANNRQISHALGGEPEFIVIQNVTAPTGIGSHVYCKYYAESNQHLFDGSLNHLRVFDQNPSVWGAMPGASHFTVNNPRTVAPTAYWGNTNDNGQNFIAYLFRSIPGVARIGNYVGDGAASKTIDVGFTPTLVMFNELMQTQASFGSTDWYIWSKLASNDSPNTKALSLPGDLREGDVTTPLTFGSTGFTVASNELNTRYIYLAFA